MNKTKLSIRISLFLTIFFLGVCNLSAQQLREHHWGSQYNNNVKIHTLTVDGRSYGYSFWMKRSSKKIKAKYFASGDAYRNYQNWKSGKEIFLVCSGAYSNSEIPVGFTVDNGTRVNSNIEDEMDGLVIVYATGGVVVSDIDDCDLWLASLKKHICLRNRSDKYDLIDWAETEEATMFQTHLLAYRNKLRIGVNAPRETAERRMLILAKNKRGDVYHIVYDITRETYLYRAADMILKDLNDQDMEVIAMMNLDTGMYNIIEAKDQRGHTFRSEGQVREATNLLVYYYED
jgi:hypothetical protein